MQGTPKPNGASDGGSCLNLCKASAFCFGESIVELQQHLYSGEVSVHRTPTPPNWICYICDIYVNGATSFWSISTNDFFRVASEDSVI